MISFVNAEMRSLSRLGRNSTLLNSIRDGKLYLCSSCGATVGGAPSSLLRRTLFVDDGVSQCDVLLPTEARFFAITSSYCSCSNLDEPSGRGTEPAASSSSSSMVSRAVFICAGR